MKSRAGFLLSFGLVLGLSAQARCVNAQTLKPPAQAKPPPHLRGKDGKVPTSPPAPAAPDGTNQPSGPGPGPGQKKPAVAVQRPPQASKPAPAVEAPNPAPPQSMKPAPSQSANPAPPQNTNPATTEPAAPAATAPAPQPPQQQPVSPLQSTPAPAAPAVDTKASSSSSLAPWLLGGVGVAALGAGTVFAVLGSNSNAKAEATCPLSPPQPCSAADVHYWRSHTDQAQTNFTVAYIGWGVGSAAVLGSAAWLFFGGDKNETVGASESSGVSFAPVISPNYWSLSASRTF